MKLLLDGNGHYLVTCAFVTFDAMRIMYTVCIVLEYALAERQNQSKRIWEISELFGHVSIVEDIAVGAMSRYVCFNYRKSLMRRSSKIMLSIYDVADRGMSSHRWRLMLSGRISCKLYDYSIDVCWFWVS